MIKKTKKVKLSISRHIKFYFFRFFHCFIFLNFLFVSIFCCFEVLFIAFQKLKLKFDPTVFVFEFYYYVMFRQWLVNKKDYPLFILLRYLIFAIENKKSFFCGIFYHYYAHYSRYFKFEPQFLNVLAHVVDRVFQSKKVNNLIAFLI
ncbi:hypothetical protein RFI_21828 [Reticulomyxa filosa]|uniref:Uncharacterized protein n=1 Tax=Reticulomyxa filosa TaxID=46433 RepID=X6MPE0_RETFI|nr:hypothetical protein RFI_21828 [Reticulomyxa filosa]|eukprot:ETO15536.1 hypothetical protein RFI_21828 [Reticulomyxa filosa]